SSRPARRLPWHRSCAPPPCLFARTLACGVVRCSRSGCLVADLIVLDRIEADRFPALGLVVEPEFVRGKEHGVAVEVARYIAAMRLDEALDIELAVGRDPAADGETRHLEID